jgi:hypothetical protein
MIKSELLVPVFGAKEKKFMKQNKKKYSTMDKPVGQLTRIADFLPPPDQLVMPENTVKVTLALDRQSLLFFKRKASKLGIKYQKMIRELLKGYVAHYS